MESTQQTLPLWVSNGNKEALPTSPEQVPHQQMYI